MGAFELANLLRHEAKEDEEEAGGEEERFIIIVQGNLFQFLE